MRVGREREREAVSEGGEREREREAVSEGGERERELEFEKYILQGLKFRFRQKPV